MIHCTRDSACQVNISNTTFYQNTGGNFDGEEMANGILLIDGANGTVFVESCTFIGSNINNTFWYNNDSTIELIGNENVFINQLTNI